MGRTSLTSSGTPLLAADGKKGSFPRQFVRSATRDSFQGSCSYTRQCHYGTRGLYLNSLASSTFRKHAEADLPISRGPTSCVVMSAKEVGQLSPNKRMRTINGAFWLCDCSSIASFHKTSCEQHRYDNKRNKARDKLGTVRSGILALSVAGHQVAAVGLLHVMVVVQVVDVRGAGREREHVLASDERVVLLLFLRRLVPLEVGPLEVAVHVLPRGEGAAELTRLLARGGVADRYVQETCLLLHQLD